jgi:predicted ATPase/DNA-binding CsgD family transcriptional regulator
MSEKMGTMDGILPLPLVEPFSPREVEILRLLKEGLTNQEIAQELFISIKTVKWYNQQIYAKLGVNNRTRAIDQARRQGVIEAEAAAPAQEQVRLAGRLPAVLSSFIGRKAELSGLAHLLRSGPPRLVTVTGAGGVGKTSLAIQAGWKLHKDFADGVFFLPLAAIQEARLVIPTLASALGLHEISGRPPAEMLQDYLAPKRLLLILDNFEQVIEAGPQVCDLLKAAPGVKALVTSREALHLTGEQVFPLEPLSLPPSGGRLSFEEMAGSEAVQLFVGRAQGLRPDFRLTVENAPAVMEICCRLDGLPLAIELAAARIPLFTPQEMIEQLGHRLGLLVEGMRDLPARQQTMRASIEWSHALLSPPEQALFRRMAVFSGGCRFDAAEAVCGEGGVDVIQGTASLVHQHLLRRMESGGETRLGMLETVREFALECLEWSGEGPAVHRRHAEYYAGWEEWNSQHMDLLDTEIENIRAAMRWSIDSGQVKPGLRLTDNDWFWQKREVEIQSWLDELLSSPGAQVPSLEKVGAIRAAFFQALSNQDYARCQGYIDQVKAVAAALNDEGTRICARYLEGHLCIGHRIFEGAEAAFIEGLARWKALGDPYWIGQLTFSFACSQYLLDHYDATEAALLETVEIFTRLQKPSALIDALFTLGYLMLNKKDPPRSRYYFGLAIDQSMAIGFEAKMPDLLNGLAALAVQQGQWARAGRLYGASNELAARMGFPSREPPQLLISRRYLATLRERLDPAILESVWQEGRRMTKDEALAYGLAET